MSSCCNICGCGINAGELDAFEPAEEARPEVEGFTSVLAEYFFFL